MTPKLPEIFLMDILGHFYTRKKTTDCFSKQTHFSEHLNINPTFEADVPEELLYVKVGE